MLPTHEYVATYNGHEIYQRKPGFEFTPMMLGKIASFLIRGADGSIAIAAFMYSLLTAIEGDTPAEDSLLTHAVETIQAGIDETDLSHHQELTFEYRDGAWVRVSSPQWWITVFP